MNQLKFASNLTIANIVLIVITIITIFWGVFTQIHSFIPDKLYYILLSTSLLLCGISWLVNIIEVYRHFEMKWLLWLNTILTVIAGYYLLFFITIFFSELYFRAIGRGWYQVDMFYLLSKPEFPLYAIRNAWSLITICLCIAWMVQYIINSVFIIKAYAENKQTKD